LTHRTLTPTTTMSYTPYTPPTTAGAPTSTTYPYGAYQGAYAGAYSYQANPYHTGVTSYAWPYPYAGYIPPQHPQTPQVQRTPAQTATPAPATTPAPVTSTATTTAATVTPAPPQRSTTFTTYNPSVYVRDNTQTAASTSYTGSKSKRQSNMRGLFAKECQNLHYTFEIPSRANLNSVKSLMYGFGDDRNPSNDTVAVMEEILIEYIADVVSGSMTC
jgi:transcription initiation factor TFIID subunit 13